MGKYTVVNDVVYEDGEKYCHVNDLWLYFAADKNKMLRALQDQIDQLYKRVQALEHKSPVPHKVEG